MVTEVKASAAGRQIPIVCPGHTRPLAELQFCTVNDKDENRTFLVSACHDKMPMLRDAVTGDWIGTFEGHKGAVWSCRLDPAGYICATASGDFSVKVWDAVTGASLFTFPHKHIVKTLDFSPDSRYLATGGHEGLLRIYDLSVQAEKKDKDKESKAEVMKLCAIPHLGADQKKVTITKCVWWKDDLVLAACADGTIRFWKTKTQEVIQTLKVDAEVRDMELSSSNEILTVAAGDKVYFFDMRDSSNGELLHAYKMPIHFREEGGATLHPSGKKFVAGGSDLWVRVFDFASGEELECHKGHHGPIRCLRYAPDGKTYATGSEDGTIRLWQTDP